MRIRRTRVKNITQSRARLLTIYIFHLHLLHIEMRLKSSSQTFNKEKTPLLCFLKYNLIFCLQCFRVYLQRRHFKRKFSTFLNTAFPSYFAKAVLGNEILNVFELFSSELILFQRIKACCEHERTLHIHIT